MFTPTDYDKLRQIMAESPEKNDLIERLLDSHKMTLRMVSHEIRNPLTLIYSTLQLLEAQHPELTTYKHWKHMREDVEYTTQLLEELSSLNNSELLRISLIDCTPFLKNIVLSFASSLVDTNIAFTSKIEPHLPLIDGDAVKLKEVFLNLLRNASEAVADEGTISLHAYADSQFVHVKIVDNGCGIPADELEDLFVPFVTHKQGGTGLGLAIADQVVHAHHGKLSVHSVEHVSTTFSLSLPIKQNA